MNRYLSALRTLVRHRHPLRFIISRILLRLKISLPLTAQFSHNPLVRVYVSANPIAHTAWLGEAEPLEVAVFKQYIKPTDTVFDVGANVGTHALLAAKVAHLGRVYAFEPGAGAFAALQKNIVLNNVKNITTYNAAVSAEGAHWQLVQPGRSDEQSFLAPATADTDGLKTILLETVMVDNQLTNIDFLKIDVEGAELLVLQSLGLRAKDVRKIFFENLPEAMGRYGYDQDELYRWFMENGFSMYTFTDDLTIEPIKSLVGAAANILALREE